MTFEEAVDLYGKVELEFSSYYKYVFTYTGTDGKRMFQAQIGDGDSYTIYGRSLPSAGMLEHLPIEGLRVSHDKGATWEECSNG